MDEHGEALKRMGGRLTRLEESKLKKPPHVEIHDDEEEDEEMKRTKWNMKETMAMREKMEKMQLAFHKEQGMDDYLYNMGGMSSKAPIVLPPKFKISDAEKFDGTRDLKLLGYASFKSYCMMLCMTLCYD